MGHFRSSGSSGHRPRRSEEQGQRGNGVNGDQYPKSKKNKGKSTLREFSASGATNPFGMQTKPVNHERRDILEQIHFLKCSIQQWNTGGVAREDLLAKLDPKSPDDMKKFGELERLAGLETALKEFKARQPEPGL